MGTLHFEKHVAEVQKNTFSPTAKLNTSLHLFLSDAKRASTLSNIFQQGKRGIAAINFKIIKRLCQENKFNFALFSLERWQRGISPFTQLPDSNKISCQLQFQILICSRRLETIPPPPPPPFSTPSLSFSISECDFFFFRFNSFQVSLAFFKA